MQPANQIASSADPASFVARFQAYWHSPHTVALSTVLTSDVILKHPLGRPLHGLQAAESWRRGLLAMLPGLRGDVLSWSASGELLFIELRLRASAPDYQLEWPLVDRFRLRGGLACERVSYFDGLELLKQMARQPSTWGSLLRWAAPNRPGQHARRRVARAAS